jgi:uncharacterized membrane protein YgcG
MNFFKKRWVAITLTALTVLGSLAYGLYRRPVPVAEAAYGDWSYDGAALISQETELLIDGYNARWSKEYGSVTAFATVPNTNNWDIEEYAEAMGEKWGLRANDQLLLLDARGDEYYLVTAESVEDAVGYDRIEDLVENEFEPPYANGSYDIAVQQFYTGLDDCYETHLGGGTSASYQYSPYDHSMEQDDERAGIGLIPLLILAVIILSAIDKNRYRKWYGSRGTMAGFVPLLFWHGASSGWFRRMGDEVRRARPTVTPTRPVGHRSNGMPPPGRRVSNYQRGGYGGTAMQPRSFSGGKSVGGSFGGGKGVGGSRGGGSFGGGKGVGGHR